MKTGLYLDLSKLDGRTSIAKAAKQVLEALREFVGDTTVIHEILLHRITYKTIRLSLYEAAKMEENGMAKEADHYLPMANSLRLDIAQLEKMVGNGRKLPDLDEYVEVTYGDKKGKK